MEVNLMGFLKFLLAVVLILGGIFLIIAAFMGGISIGLSNTVNGSHTSSLIAWIMGIIGFVGCLGGVYMLRGRSH
jgi:hypothetical protein